jgi:hypothetical protein
VHAPVRLLGPARQQQQMKPPSLPDPQCGSVGCHTLGLVVSRRSPALLPCRLPRRLLPPLTVKPGTDRVNPRAKRPPQLMGLLLQIVNGLCIQEGRVGLDWPIKGLGCCHGPSQWKDHWKRVGPRILEMDSAFAFASQSRSRGRAGPRELRGSGSSAG